MVIDVVINYSYGSKEMTNKYSPFSEIILNENDPTHITDCKSLFINRFRVLEQCKALDDLWYFPGPIVVNPDRTPMVVISSNRAEWMDKILGNAQQSGSFTGYTDINTFANDIVPWYTPLRSKRPLFVVVHATEYEYYVKKISKYENIFVIGYLFDNQAYTNVGSFVGFGASRNAAIDAIISLGYHKAWVIDDNVVNINYFPNELDFFEKIMTEDIWAISFSGATEIIPSDNFWGIAEKLKEPDGTKLISIKPEQSKQTHGLLQQAVLWNLDLLRKYNINFSPIFVTSNEDVSMSNFLNYKERRKNIIFNAYEVIKVTPEREDNEENWGGKLFIPQNRKKIYQLFKSVDNLNLRFKDRDKNVKEVDLPTLAKYITQETSVKDELLNQMRIVEMIMSEAIRLGPKWYPEGKLFPPNKLF